MSFPVQLGILIPEFNFLTMSEIKNSLSQLVSYSEVVKFRKLIIKWGETGIINYPWRMTDNYWHAIVAEIMLQRTRVQQVLPVYLDFCERFPTPVEYLTAVSKEFYNPFHQLGLNWRNDRLIMTAKYILSHGIPHDIRRLKKTPGIGDYIASAFLTIHFNKRVILIDSNIIRVFIRFFGIEKKNEMRRNREFLTLVEKFVPRSNPKEYNLALLDLSMNLCKPNPLCSSCPLQRNCLYSRTSRIQSSKKKTS